jgi:hypothetical protein
LTSPKTYVRIAGSTGFAGSWQDKNELPEGERDEIISITGDTYHEEYPGGTRLALNAKLDGPPFPCPEIQVENLPSQPDDFREDGDAKHDPLSVESVHLYDQRRHQDPQRRRQNHHL